MFILYMITSHFTTILSTHPSFNNLVFSTYPISILYTQPSAYFVPRYVSTVRAGIKNPGARTVVQTVQTPGNPLFPTLFGSLFLYPCHQHDTLNVSTKLKHIPTKLQKYGKYFCNTKISHASFFPTKHRLICISCRHKISTKFYSNSISSLTFLTISTLV